MNLLHRSFRIIPVLILIGGCATSNVVDFNSSQPQSTESSSSTETNFTYDNYGTVLSSYVNQKGEVNYKDLQQNRQSLDDFNQSLSGLSPAVYDSWTENEKIAFWVNIYNSLTLQAILDNYPTKSIRDIPGVWKRLKFSVMGQDLTLDQIEHQILRKQFDEPRIHMGLVCASVGCPVLRQEPYVGERLEQQLDEQTRLFLGLNRNFKIDQNQEKVYLSSIFKWFGEDFVSKHAAQDQFAGNNKERAVLNFVQQYLEPQNQTYLTQGEYKIAYLDYDWSLNEKID